MSNARRGSTAKLYECYLGKWQKFCSERGANPLKGTINLGLEFLQDLLHNRGYSAVATARSALSTIIMSESGVPFGTHPDVCCFMKGVSNIKPPATRYTVTWDTDIVLQFLRKWKPAHKLSLKKLTLKVCMLILLVTGQRGQILLSLRVNNMEVSTTEYQFKVENADLKQGRLGYKPGIILLKAFPEDKSLCVHHYVSTYLKRTLKMRGQEKSLLLTTRPPYHAPSRDTISRWVKTVMRAAGIDISLFAPGSTRAAASSKAEAAGASIDEILKGGGWSRASTFTKWYKKPIHKKQKPIGDYVLKSQSHK